MFMQVSKESGTSDGYREYRVKLVSRSIEELKMYDEFFPELFDFQVSFFLHVCIEEKRKYCKQHRILFTSALFTICTVMDQWFSTFL